MRSTVSLVILILAPLLVTDLACKEKSTGSGSATENRPGQEAVTFTAADGETLTPPDIKLARFDVKLNNVDYTIEAPEGSVVRSDGGGVGVVHGSDFGFHLEIGNSELELDRKWWKDGGGIYTAQRFLLDTPDQLLVETRERGEARFSASALATATYVDVTVHSARDGSGSIDVETKANCLLVLRCAKTLTLKSSPPTDPLKLLAWLTPFEPTKNAAGQVEEIKLGNTVSDHGLPILRQFPTLKVLTIDGAHVTPAGLAAIDGLPGVETVTLNPAGALPAETFKHIATFPNLTSLTVGAIVMIGDTAGRVEIDDAGIAELQKARKLQTLELIQTSVTDKGMAGLKGISSLKELKLVCKLSSDPTNRSFAKTSFYTDAGLDALAGLPQLESLSLMRADINGSGLKNLTGATKLKDLNLADSLVDDEGLKNLAGVKSLTSLNLSQTKVTDAGLAALEGLTNLQTLHLSGNTDLTDTALKHLAGLVNLRELHLDKTAISDAGLQQLSGLKKLLHLTTENTKVTPAGIKAFEQARDAK